MCKHAPAAKFRTVMQTQVATCTCRTRLYNRSPPKAMCARRLQAPSCCLNKVQLCAWQHTFEDDRQSVAKVLCPTGARRLRLQLKLNRWQSSCDNSSDLLHSGQGNVQCCSKEYIQWSAPGCSHHSIQGPYTTDGEGRPHVWPEACLLAHTGNSPTHMFLFSCEPLCLPKSYFTNPFAASRFSQHTLSAAICPATCTGPVGAVRKDRHGASLG